MNHSPSPKATFRTGELARLAGVSTDTLRHYERRGLLAPTRADNGYRQYPAGALDRVLLIRRALSIGFRLEDLAHLLQTRDRGGAPCREVRDLAASRLNIVEEQIAALTQLSEVLQTMLQDWDTMLANLPEGEHAWLLEGLRRNAGVKALGR